MPQYKYIAKINPQKTIQAQIEAESQQDAINKLTRMGYFPLSIKPEFAAEEERKQVNPFRKKSGKQIVLFTRQLANLINSGVNIVNGLNIIADQSSNAYLKSVVMDVLSKIKDGKSFSVSLGTHPYLFSPLYCSMIRVGETAGNLDGVLMRLADFMEKEQEVKDTLRSSLVYPAFILGIGILTVAVLLVFVIPKLTGMFEDLGQMLPLPTRILINLSNFLRYYWWLIFMFLSLAVFSFKQFVKNQQGRLIWDSFKLRIIFLGPLILKNELSHFTRTLALLLSNGISIISSLEVSASIVNNQILKSEILGFMESVSNGNSLSGVFKESRYFPEYVTSIVGIGEETGSLDKALLRIADDYEKEIDRLISSLMRLLEPVIILAIGLVVGFIVLSMLLPIFQINLIVR